MNRTLTVEIKDIPDEVWSFLVNEKGSEEAVDDLVREMLTDKATTAMVVYYQMRQAQKAGIPLSTMIPDVVDRLVDIGEAENTGFGDDLKIEAERKVSELVNKIEESKDAED